MPETQSRYRSSWLFFCCVVLGTACIVAGALLYVAERNLFNADRFAERAQRSLSDPRVAEYAATLVTDTAIRSRPDLIAFRPLILASARSMVQARPFGVLVEISAKRAHEALLSEGARRVVLTLPDLQLLVQDTLQQANPAIAERVPKQLNNVVARLGEGREAQWVLRIVESRQALTNPVACAFPGGRAADESLAIWVCARSTARLLPTGCCSSHWRTCSF